MPDDPADELGQVAALRDLDEALQRRWPGATALAPGYLKGRYPGRQLSAGWVLPAAVLGIETDLLLLCDELYPHSLPIVSLPKPVTGPVVPHVERDGVFCLSGPGTLAVLPADERHARDQIDAALKAWHQGATGINHQDFIDEFASYWTLAMSGYNTVGVLLDDLRRSGEVVVATAGRTRVIAANRDQALRWLTNMGHPEAAITVNRGVHAYLPRAIYPRDYPITIPQVLGLLGEAGGNVTNALVGILSLGQHVTATFAFPGSNQDILAALRLQAPTTQGSGLYASVPITKGFRPGKVPARVLRQRLTTITGLVERHRAMRLDRQALLDRTAGESSRRLDRTRVALIGAGVIGSQVVTLLAQSGVRHLTIVDGEDLAWQNLGRHVLTGLDVGRNKAEAMRANLLERFPDLDVKAHKVRWQRLWRENSECFDGHDLVISATGEWLSEAWLNRLTRHHAGFPPVLFGWVEAYALAGHAVAVLPIGGCLHCLSTERGQFLKPVADVDSAVAIRREPSCGAVFQPFSALSAAPVAAMITRLAIDILSGDTATSEHRVWTAPRRDFDAYNALITTHWFERLERDGYERVLANPLPANYVCPVCRP